jgi:hypothetical protein
MSFLQFLSTFRYQSYLSQNLEMYYLIEFYLINLTLLKNFNMKHPDIVEFCIPLLYLVVNVILDA